MQTHAHPLRPTIECPGTLQNILDQVNLWSGPGYSELTQSYPRLL